MDGITERVTRVEIRLTGLEERLGRIETRIDGMDGRLRSVEQGIAEVKGKLDTIATHLVAKLPSWWQFPAVIGGTLTFATGVVALLRHFGLF